jgi:hypothetical protein
MLLRKEDEQSRASTLSRTAEQVKGIAPPRPAQCSTRAKISTRTSTEAASTTRPVSGSVENGKRRRRRKADVGEDNENVRSVDEIDELMSAMRMPRCVRIKGTRHAGRSALMRKRRGAARNLTNHKRERAVIQFAVLVATLSIIWLPVGAPMSPQTVINQADTRVVEEKVDEKVRQTADVPISGRLSVLVTILAMLCLQMLLVIGGVELNPWPASQLVDELTGMDLRPRKMRRRRNVSITRFTHLFSFFLF